MDDEEYKMECYLRALIVFVLGGLILLFGACSSVKGVQVVTEYRDRETVKVEQVHDSVFVHDSVSSAMRHDTLLLERWHTIWREREVFRGDTVTVRDSIPYEVQVVQEVRARNGYDKFTARGFWVFVALVVLAIAVWIGKKTPWGKVAWSFVKAWL